MRSGQANVCQQRRSGSVLRRAVLVGKKYPHGDTLTLQDANYGENVGDTTPVGSYPANAYGLYDMAGNVWEWCLDTSYGDFYVTQGIKKFLNIFINIKGSRVVRGGSWGQSGSKRTSRHSRPRFAREQRELRGFSVCEGCIPLTYISLQ